MSAVGVLAFGDDITDQALYVAVELQDFFEACCLLVCDVLDFALFLYLCLPFVTNKNSGEGDFIFLRKSKQNFLWKLIF